MFKTPDGRHQPSLITGLPWILRHRVFPVLWWTYRIFQSEWLVQADVIGYHFCSTCRSSLSRMQSTVITTATTTMSQPTTTTTMSQPTTTNVDILHGTFNNAGEQQYNFYGPAIVSNCCTSSTCVLSAMSVFKFIRNLLSW
jgi:hypothetical protein